MKNLFYLLCFLLVSCFYEKNDNPNIILFMVDDLGWQDTSVPFWSEETEFNKLYNTPNMKKLANMGVKFTNAYATPVCSPTRISLMTGMNSVNHRVTNWTLHPNVKKPAEINHEEFEFPDWNYNGLSTIAGINNTVYATSLPQILKDNGYYTIHAGKAHLGAISFPSSDPSNIGFDINIAGHAAGAPQSYLGIENFGNGDKKKGGTRWVAKWPEHMRLAIGKLIDYSDFRPNDTNLAIEMEKAKKVEGFPKEILEAAKEDLKSLKELAMRLTSMKEADDLRAGSPPGA